MLYPKIGIRPVIDGRWGGVRESLENQTMGMANAAKALIETNIRYPDGTPVQCVISETTIGGGAEAAKCAEQFSKENVVATLSVTPCWCYGSETFDMDPQTITLYAPEQWTERFFGQEVNAQKHVIVLCSREGESYWLHTRGMAEFGRPDIGISGVPEGKVDAYKLIIDQMIYYGGLGAFFDRDTRVHTADGKAYVIRRTCPRTPCDSVR